MNFESKQNKDLNYKTLKLSNLWFKIKTMQTNYFKIYQQQ